MNVDANDTAALARVERFGAGLLFAGASAVSFGMSGPIASSMFEIGWTPEAVVLLRVGLAAAMLAPFGLRSLRRHARTAPGAWRRELPTILVYGLLAVGASQFCYFSAVEHMEVGPAILIEYTSPAAVVLWLWLRHGQRPGAVTVAGAAVAAVGLVLVLDLVGGGVGLSTVGVLWALGAMLGGATYFVLNAEGGIDLPPLALAWLGLVVGTAVLGLLGLTRMLPLHAAAGAVRLAEVDVPWWVAVLVLGAVTAALAYATGIAAGRLLGARLASFVALLEVVSSVLFAWVLLGELPGAVQVVGGLLILAGVIAVRAGEPSAAVHAATDQLPATAAAGALGPTGLSSPTEGELDRDGGGTRRG